MTTPQPAAAPTPRPTAVGAQSGIDAHQVMFSGQGGEYFRVWIVNILLKVITVGLYTPWARRRTARYFYDHTVLAGHPLEFTAPIRKMVFGFVALLGLYLAFEIAGRAGQDVAVAVMIVGAAALAPFGWASAMRFRLGSTRWRGLQFRFDASWKEIYAASWPVFAVAGMWIVVIFVVDPRAQFPDASKPQLPDIHPGHWALLVFALAASLAGFVRLEFNYTRLLFLRSGIGGQAGCWKPSYRAFVRIWLASVGVFLAVLVLVGAPVGLGPLGIDPVGGGVAGMLSEWGAGGVVFAMWLLVLWLIVPLALFVAFTPAWAWREARLFALVWSGVGLGRIARVRSTLDPWRFVRLRVMNTILTLLTLGLYRPFAKVSEYRMKTESVTVYVRGDLDAIVGRLEREQGGLSDALADAVGLDLVG
jgi:uncharacterized membrane protein YjgN (DUF898 family)